MSKNVSDSDARRVVILVTRASGKNIPVCRVAIMEDHEQLTLQADHPSFERGVFNRARALEHFGEVRTLSENDARRLAKVEADRSGLRSKEPVFYRFPLINFPAKPKPSIRAFRQPSSASPTTES